MIETNNDAASVKPQTKSRFITELEKLVRREDGAKDRATLAQLRRGLGKPPKAAMEMYPFLGQFLSENPSKTRENAVFIVAALFAYYPDAKTDVGNLGASLRHLKDDSGSMERRFVALLNAETEDLPEYLRHIVGLLKSKEIPINWEQLFKDVQGWSSDKGWVQKNWARSFWAAPSRKEQEENAPNISKGEN